MYKVLETGNIRCPLAINPIPRHAVHEFLRTCFTSVVHEFSPPLPLEDYHFTSRNILPDLEDSQNSSLFFSLGILTLALHTR